MSDTIVALATPLGRSGIGVIRLSGESSLDIIRQLTNDINFDPKPRSAILKKVYHTETADLIDETIITFFKSPESFTGEDVIEISCHGSPVVLRQIIDLCLTHGARIAEPGEFSLRALSNERLNLAQAEAIRDIINAQTISTARLAVRQLKGEISHQLQPLKDQLLDIIVTLESALEFVEDDLPEFQLKQIRNDLIEIKNQINKFASTFQAGKLLREGIKVALVGRPNVGKSSLFNALLGHERAIVTEIAGTTRDQLFESLTIDNIPVSLIDTAGLRETSDLVESIGVERSKRIISDADIVVVLLDASVPITPEDEEIIRFAREFISLYVFNKIDLVDSQPSLSNFKDFPVPSSRILHISAKTGFGLQRLRNELINPFRSNDLDDSGFLISDSRHFDLLNRAENEIERSITLLDNSVSEEIILLGLHNALIYLGQITGETTTEDMLSRIFSTFCIGK